MSSARIVIAGTHSGAGKTSITLALVHALHRRGLRVQTFKVGPDFLDPTYLSRASERVCYNLDGWMTGKAYTCGLFDTLSALADISVVEGVMGLYDGADPDSDSGSTAQIARWLGAPILLIVDAKGMSRSIAALIKGYADFDHGVRIQAVIANRIGSERHRAGLDVSLKKAGCTPLIGAIPAGAFPILPSRHLGLTSATAENLSDDILNRLADTLEQNVDVDWILRIARESAQPAETETVESRTLYWFDKTSPRVSGEPLRIGLACDEAFHFYYPDTLEALRATGCELVRFSPLRDASLPTGLHALFLGGGYPEEYAQRLAANCSMRQDISDFAAAGKPVYAECGGLMVLSESIETIGGTRFPMTGVIPFQCRMLKKRKMLGYAEAKLRNDGHFGHAGILLRGHEFHYSEVRPSPESTGVNSAYEVRYRRASTPVDEGFQRENVFASYVHLHLASRPECIANFVSFCRELNSKETSMPRLHPKLPELDQQTCSKETRPLVHDLMEHPLSGERIEALSFAAIDSEMPAHRFTAEQWPIVRRMIHTTADFQIADDLRFSNDAIQEGIKALRQGRPIYVDSNMIRSGISLARLKKVCGSYTAASIHCHVADEDVAGQAREAGLPRSLFAVRKARESIHGGIVAFGNAPVGLMELNRLVVEEGIRPALVIGMPVGFVHVKESKEELVSLTTPYIVLSGRRGGSTIAVSVIHALAIMAGDFGEIQSMDERR